MKALVLEAVQSLAVRTVADAAPGFDGALVRVEANGVCRSDWHAWNGDFKREFPLIMGHEFTGIVEEVRPGVSRFKKGDRVVVPFSGSDGTCAHCQSGASHLCESPLIPGKTYPGGYAEYVGVPLADRNMVHLPEQVSFAEGAALGCRFMTAFHGLVYRARLAPGEWIVVYGCGVVGLSAINIAAALGAQVIGVDINPENLERARTMGAHYVINSREANAPEAVQNLTGGGAHVSVDALGIAETCVNAIQSLRKRGRHVQLGITTKAEAGYVSVPIDVIVYKELELLGSLGMAAHRFEQMLPLILSGRLSPAKLVNREVGLSDVGPIFESMTKGTNSGAYVVTNFQ
jgi:D-arabinose 1-dehydrogenase-like Zn-dependent alcohol dehydrogenase